MHSSKQTEVDVKIPMLNKNSDNAIKFNKMIQNDFNDIILEVKNDKTLRTQINAYYDHVIRDNIVYFYIYGENHLGCSINKTYQKNYFYDLKNDVILNMEQAYTHAGYTLKDLQTTAYQYWDFEYVCDNNNPIKKDEGLEESPWDMTFEKCENHYCGCGLKISNYSLVPYYIPACA